MEADYFSSIDFPLLARRILDAIAIIGAIRICWGELYIDPLEDYLVCEF